MEAALATVRTPGGHTGVMRAAVFGDADEAVRQVGLPDDLERSVEAPRRRGRG